MSLKSREFKREGEWRLPFGHHKKLADALRFAGNTFRVSNSRGSALYKVDGPQQ
jgi:hypothetical protein